MVLRLTDEEIEQVKRGLREDKLQDLEIEATQLDTPEETAATDAGDLGGGDAGGDIFGGFGDEGGGGEEAPADTDDAGGEALAELNVNDEDAPIKVDNVIRKVTSILNEEDRVEDLDEDSEEDHEMNVKEKLRKQQTSQRRGVDGILNGVKTSKYEKDTTGMKRELSDLKQSWKAPRVDEDYFRDEMNIEEYLDNKIAQNAQMTGRIKSALNSLDDFVNSQPHVISESKKSSGEKDDKQT